MKTRWVLFSIFSGLGCTQDPKPSDFDAAIVDQGPPNQDLGSEAGMDSGVAPICAWTPHTPAESTWDGCAWAE